MPPPGEGPSILGVTAIKPVERHGWEKIKFFLWDPVRGAFMGRTPKSWFLIITFYIVYYLCLIGLWSLMMYIFLTTIKTSEPKYKGEESLIGTSPGLGMRPAQPEEYIHSSMIIFNKDSELGTRYVLGWDTWKEQIDKFLGKEYKNHELEECPPNTQPDAKAPACRFNLAKLGACGHPEDNYGYSVGRPCLYFKLNRIFGVINEYYNGSETMPEEMPEELKQHIQKVQNKNQIWVNCQGENPADVEAMGPLRYFPQERGLPHQFFPYLNQRMYESPLVAVQFLNPRIGQLLHIECRAWARNIRYNRMDRMGMVHFELFVLDNKTAKLYEKSLN